MSEIVNGKGLRFESENFSRLLSYMDSQGWGIGLDYLT